MSVVYNCKHCNQKIGELSKEQVDLNILGWDSLSQSEQKEMIHNVADGKLIVQAICENCEQTLEQHPHYHEQDYFIH